MSNFGIEATYVPLVDLEQWQTAMRPNTRLLLVETPSNPLCGVADLGALGSIAHANGARLVVDNVFCTPALQNPLKLGADIVVHSATKYIDGQGRCVGGAVVTNDEQVHEACFGYLRTAGSSLSPFNAWTLLKGLETLHIRMRAHCENALEVANWLDSHPRVRRVYYPGLESHPGHELAKQQQRGFGGVLSFEVDGGRAEAWNVIDSTQILSITANLGDVKSTITHPATTTHGRLSDAQRAKAGISDALIRVSVGLESVTDIKVDLSRGL